MAIQLAACGAPAAPILVRCEIDRSLAADDGMAGLRDQLCASFDDHVAAAASGRTITHDAQSTTPETLELSLNLTSASSKPTAESITAAFTWRLGDQARTNSLTLTVVDAKLSAPMLKSLLDAFWADNQPPL